MKGTTITPQELADVFKQLDTMPNDVYKSSIDFESEYLKASERIAKDYERIKYLEMWKKVKQTFPFHNKI